MAIPRVEARDFYPELAKVGKAQCGEAEKERRKSQPQGGTSSLPWRGGEQVESATNGLYKCSS
jgi:hypothetical protein